MCSSRIASCIHSFIHSPIHPFIHPPINQASTLSFEERARVLDITAEEVKGKIPIVVGTGTIDPRTVVRLTQQAVDHGADARWVAGWMGG